MNKFYTAGFILIGLALVSACGQEQATKQPNSDDLQTAQEQPRSALLARVNNAEITQLELDLAIQKMLKKNPLGTASPELAEKILQSLVQSRAIAQSAEKELDQQQLAELEYQTRAYREELLVKQYLQNHAQPQPVSMDMVAEYYENHQDKYGGEIIKDFEYIVVYGELEDAGRKTLEKLGDHSNWKKVSEEMIEQGLSVKYKRAEVKQALLAEPLKTMLEQTEKGQIVTNYSEKEAIALRVLEKKVLSAKPITEVSSDIRRALAHRQLKKSIKELSKEILANSDIEYFNH